MNDGDKINEAEMDRILSTPDEIVPSSGFAASVMEAVRREAAAPPPIPFPWKRALPFVGLAVIALVLMVVVAVVAARQATSEAIVSNFSLGPWLGLLSAGGVGPALAWSAGALLVAFFSVKFSMRIAGGQH